MARVVWDHTEDIIAADADRLIRYEPRDSYENFRPPAQIESDFTRLLQHEVKHVNWSYELIHDWYYVNSQTEASLADLSNNELRKMYKRGTRVIRVSDKRDEDGNLFYYVLDENGGYERTFDYKPEYIRGQQTSIDWKSKIGNSDMSTNFKTDYTHEVQKGDYVIREDGMLYMLNWNITLHANNQATQSVECNAIVDFEREMPDIVDENGYLLEEGGWKPICPGLPISHSEYAGRPDYSGASLQAGMHPDHLISVYCQWNTATRQIRLDDRFVIGDFTYKVMNISLAEVMIDRGNGILTINAKRVAGGTVDGLEE